MLTASNALKNYLATTISLMYADLFTFTLKAGTVLRYTTADRPVVYLGNTFTPSGPQVKHNGFKTTVGVSIDKMELQISAMPTDIILLSLPLLQAVRAGLFDQAAVKVERLFMPTWGDTSLGSIFKFGGNVADTQLGRITTTLACKSELEKLATQLPKNILEPGCYHTVFDAGCTLNPATYRVASTVLTAVGSKALTCALAQAAGYWDLGILTFTGGPNNGLSYTIKTYTPGSLELQVPPLFPVGVGDTFTVLPGCDKSKATCTTKFSNLANFAGFPYVPAPEAAL